MDWSSWFWGFFVGFLLAGISWIWVSISRRIGPPEPPTRKNAKELLSDPSGVYWLWREDYQTSWWFDVNGTAVHVDNDMDSHYYLWRIESPGCLSLRKTHFSPEEFPGSPSSITWLERIETTFLRFEVFYDNGHLCFRESETGHVFYAD